MYAASADPWQLLTRWYEHRKYAITLALLPHRHYRHAFEPGCSIGTLTQRLAHRCDAITAADVAADALRRADRRLRTAGVRERVRLVRQSLDDPWPAVDFDLIVLSEVGYYLHADTLRATLDRELAQRPGATLITAHWRHLVSDYPIGGDQVHDIVAATTNVQLVGGYRDRDVVIDVFSIGAAVSVAEREGVPGSSRIP